MLGANDGIVSTASLVVGVAASHASLRTILLTGVAGLVAGAMSMAAGEYVSVSSQADTEDADLTRERQELAEDPHGEREELANIYVKRGLEKALARQVADQLMKRDALGAHARDELGISEVVRARPVQAGVASAASFSAGAAVPLLAVLLSPDGHILPTVSLVALAALAGLGALAGRAGGAPVGKAIARVVFWGILAMAVTAGVGALFGTPAG